MLFCVRFYGHFFYSAFPYTFFCPNVPILFFYKLVFNACFLDAVATIAFYKEMSVAEFIKTVLKMIQNDNSFEITNWTAKDFK